MCKSKFYYKFYIKINFKIKLIIIFVKQMILWNLCIVNFFKNFLLGFHNYITYSIK
jgi:hypothetical protein